MANAERNVCTCICSASFLKITSTKVVYWHLTALFGCCMASATWNWNFSHLSTSFVYTIQPCTSWQCHLIQSHTGRVHVCLAVTSHLHFWCNDRDLLCATEVAWGWNGYQNKTRLRAQKVYPGKENSPATPVGTQTWDLLITSPILKPLSCHHSQTSES